MIHEVYQEIQEIDSQQSMENWEIEYSISNNQVSCKQQIILFGLNLHLYPNKPIQYEKVEDFKLVFEKSDKEKVLSFMQKASFKVLKLVQEDTEAILLLQYMQKILKYDHQIKMILKFKPEIEQSKLRASANTYVLIYFFTQPICAKIEDFCICKIPIKDAVTKNKLNLLGIDSSSQTKNPIYDMRKQEKLGIKLLKPRSLQELNQSSSFTLSISNQSISKDEIQTFTHQQVAVFGAKDAVNKYIRQLEKEIKRIKVKTFQSKDKLFADFIFHTMSNILQSYHKMKIVLLNFGEAQVYYHDSVAEVFSYDMKRKDYKEVSMDKFKKLDKYFLQRIQKNTPDMFVFSNEQGNKTMIAKSGLISCLTEAAKNKILTKEQEKVQQKQKMAELNLAEDKNENYQIQFLNNISIRQDNYEEVAKQFKVFKTQQHMTFKIEIGSHIRITNRVKTGILYFVFDQLVEILQLQTVVEAEVNMKTILMIINDYKYQCLPQPRTVEFESSGLKIKLVPTQINNLIMGRREDFYRNLVKSINDDKQPHFRTVVCTPTILKQFMMYSHINFPLNFVINVSRPCFQMDNYFNDQTKNERQKIGKGSLNHYHYLKAGVSNTKFSPNNEKKDKETLKQIMQNNIHDYEIGDFILSEVDQFNISYMIGEGIEQMFFTLSKLPQNEYVYLTFHEILVKIKRDKFGNFLYFERAELKDLRGYEKQLKPVINRAFITGQKFISFNIPYLHIKLAKLCDITIRRAGNYNLVMYYLTTLKQSQRYKIQFKKQLSLEYIKDRFTEHYVIKFENKELKDKIKELSFGNNALAKKKQGKFISMESKFYICLKILNSFKEFYEQRMRR